MPFISIENRDKELYPSIWTPVTIKVPLTIPNKATNLQEMIVDGQTLKEGSKRDEGKPRWELLPYDAVEGAVCILTSGAVKYTPRNWEKGIAYGRVFGAIMRHLWKWWMAKVVGETGFDGESGKSHLDHALCELLFLCAYEKRGMTKFDDRPTK